ncbi:M14 family metallopeptidase [Costertonia aggregata]|uniref:Peptidase M14 domain-containing protein n=1 Tax=Costertonia aggregata TaxID=343403 RepID=A0A7H9ATJ0_9FLAO|nr:M14 family metallopeptidase [Costertonia aggregata]QLG46760.1 hypothetical protein HYG79_15835 [Costertonia aggregata]
MESINRYVVTATMVFIVFSCKNSKKTATGYQGQGPSPIVSTVSKPVQKQWKGIWSFADSTTFFSNDFESGRLNGLTDDDNDHYTALITAENTPINVSPWYAFKVWTKFPRTVTIKMTYQDSRSRYYPKISKDGYNFMPLDSANFKPINPGQGEYGIKAAPEFVEITIPIDEKPTWVTAQELYGSTRVKQWVDSLSVLRFVKNYEIGKSKENRAIHLLEVGNTNTKKAIMVISRQHPPEVTGFLAMKSFVETLCSDTPQAIAFREKYTMFISPLMNPDGVDNGHWRHNMGGVDLNRDWEQFNQPETSSIRDFLNLKSEENYVFDFGIDFHSTWDDIYYPLDSTVTKKKGEIVFEWIKNIGQRLPSKKTNISASKNLRPTMVSRNYFFVNHNMPAIVFELGDNTPRPFLKLKGQVAAEELMKLLMK